MIPQNQIFRIVVVSLALVFTGVAEAQENPIALPVPTQPSTRPRHVAQVPQRFKRLEFEGRTFFVRPEDEPWLTEAVRSGEPATMPATMPTDLLHNLKANRDQIKASMTAHLGIDPARVDEYFDERLTAFLRRMEEMSPPIIYLVVSGAQLKQIARAGWTDPRYRYNPVADDVYFSTNVSLNLDEVGDDTVLPLFYDDAQPVEQRQRRVVAEMRGTEGSILTAVSQRTQAMMLVAMVELISTHALDPLDLKADQEWFGVGVAGVMGAKYTALLTGMDEQRLLSDMTRADPRNPMRPASIDMLHPTDPANLRPDWIGAYTDAYRRRAMQIIWRLVREGGDDAIAKVIAAMQQTPPPDGPALLQLIRQATDVDLSAEFSRG